MLFRWKYPSTLVLISEILSLMLHTTLHYPLPFLIAGILLLLFGRSLFWLFVAIAGFAAGVEATTYLFPHQTELFVLIVAVILGIIGALLAIFLQKLAIVIAGFIAGGHLAAVLGSPYLVHEGLKMPVAWVCFIVGGILGAILLYAFFNWALIILSSLYGSHLILREFLATHHYLPLFIILLALVGILFQASIYRRKRVVSVQT
jgi:hypothetical protein